MSIDNLNYPHIEKGQASSYLALYFLQTHKEPSVERKVELTIGCVKLKGGREAFWVVAWSCESIGIIKLKSPAFSVHSIRKRATGKKQTKPSNKR